MERAQRGPRERKTAELAKLPSAQNTSKITGCCRGGELARHNEGEGAAGAIKEKINFTSHQGREENENERDKSRGRRGPLSEARRRQARPAAPGPVRSDKKSRWRRVRRARSKQTS